MANMVLTDLNSIDHTSLLNTMNRNWNAMQKKGIIRYLQNRIGRQL